ncbi:OmpA family protein [Aureibacter tunicatorum]|uniref:Outer membrane protein OmpA-like peptidoglycan-associated protein/tetratricopeptide (TPR) repeat protein n=1 Tax=Aureibacter tunicatorum TaxID=866807 RepID=A0AAE4BTP4_9BACT|nr:OmpA family protein [Aureibacter tunicatorum]MDR6240175.1 outer membrane protein OmpA-like peptidoglycan-associated protein/tetratricopeptide (TPR) repeat protein [Aureibacter tunicatorum]BDD05944.1 hypothetical protein AUTU_34270 [Aureibacter tunicatorum]
MIKRALGLFFFILACVAANTLYGQTIEKEKTPAEQLIELADEVYRSTKVISQAREMYKQAADLDPENVYANYMTGDLYLQTINKDRAAKYLVRVYELDPDYSFDIAYKIGLAYQYGYQFDLAVKYYKRYLTKLDRNRSYKGLDMVPREEVERRIRECENADEFTQLPKEYNIVNLGSKINSNAHDFAPVINADETMMIFTSRRQEDNTHIDVDEDNFYFEDIFISRKINGEWQYAQNIGNKINTIYHESNLALSPDGKTLFVYSHENRGDIYYSEADENGEWSEPKPLKGKVNSPFSETSVSISPDGETLYFASDRSEGLGGFDIYKATKDSKGNWSKISNLGKQINTPFDEESPFIDYDNKTLYFSSKGRKGMGGYDIFKSVYDEENDSWSEPENMGYPINTPDHDIYFVTTKDNKRAYFASEREGGKGYTDIYMVELEPEKKVLVQKAETNDTIPTLTSVKPELSQPEEIPESSVKLVVNIIHRDEGIPMDTKLTIKNINSNLTRYPKRLGTGKYEFILKPKEDSHYWVTAEKDKYVFISEKLLIYKPRAGEQDELEKTLFLTPIEVGVKRVLRNLYFTPTGDDIVEESYAELNKLEKLLSENPRMKIEIGGYTDNNEGGNESERIKISKKRAQKVVNHLVSLGVPSIKLKSAGYGSKDPIATNDDETEGRELNRRVEFKILEL